MPLFVYLIPVIMLWGIGPLVGIIATSVYALPPVIRMTSLGIKEVPTQVIETAQSHGSTDLQTMLQVKIPLAFPTIVMGVNQTINMVLAMVIIAGLVGGGGLGQEVFINSIWLRMGPRPDCGDDYRLYGDGAQPDDPRQTKRYNTIVAMR